MEPLCCNGTECRFTSGTTRWWWGSTLFNDDPKKYDGPERAVGLLLVGSTTESDRSGGGVGAMAARWCIVASTEVG